MLRIGNVLSVDFGPTSMKTVKIRSYPRRRTWPRCVLALFLVAGTASCRSVLANVWRWLVIALVDQLLDVSRRSTAFPGLPSYEAGLAITRTYDNCGNTSPTVVVVRSRR